MNTFQKFNEFLNESKDNDTVYFQQNTLWIAYNPGSGITKQIKGDPDKFRGFFSSDNTDTEHYDFIVEKILEWSKYETPIFKKKRSAIYKIPAYWGYGETRELSVWGGEKNPDYFLYMLISTTDSYSIISFFKREQEAISFI